MAEKETKEEKEEVELVDVTVQTAPAFKLPSGEILDTNQLLAWISNKVSEIEKRVKKIA